MTTEAEEHSVSKPCGNGDNFINDTELQDNKSIISSSTVTDDGDQDVNLGTNVEKVTNLNEEDLERQMLNIEKELRDIDTGKVNNWRKVRAITPANVLEMKLLCLHLPAPVAIHQKQKTIRVSRTKGGI